MTTAVGLIAANPTGLARFATRVILAAVVIGKFVTGRDTFNAGNDPNCIVLPQQKTIRPAPMVIDPGGTIARIKAIDVAARAKIHDSGGALRHAPCCLRVVDQGAFIPNDFATPGNLADG